MENTNADVDSADRQIGSSTTEDSKDHGPESSLEQKEKSDPEKQQVAMVRDNNDRADDGAGERMLGENDRLAQKDLEIKFISGTPTNGDAQIDIGDVDKAAMTGLTKEELMRYANDPFWIRLRWILFIAFWALWVGMLVGAIYIIIQTPKCQPPEPHNWYKQGPLIQIETLDIPDETLLKQLKDYGATGVIFKLPADETYTLTNLNEIKKITEAYNAADMNVVMDVTANYVLEQDELFQEALKNRSALDAFAHTNGEPPNWIAFAGNTAFKNVDGIQFLSQFGGERYDLRMDNPIVKEKFKNVLKELAHSGVKGVRLDKSKHYIIDSEFVNESPNPEVTEYQINDYLFSTHIHTTLRDGLGDLFAEYRDYFRNVTHDHGFLSTVDDIVRPEVYKHGDALGVDIPRFGRLEYLLDQKEINVTQTRKELEDNYKKISALRGWIQRPFTLENFKTLDATEYAIFTFLLPGVPVTTLDALAAGGNLSQAIVHELKKTRESPSCMHGAFETYTDATNQTIAYSRHKSGNPGFLVVLNPTNNLVFANYSAVENISPEIKVLLLSENFSRNSALKVKEKVETDEISVPAKAAAVFTYVAGN